MNDTSSPPAPRVTAVVLNWNQGSMSLECVAALDRQTFPCRILVVDNGSRPDERAVLTNGLGAGHELLPLPTNRGFAGGMNAGIAAAAGHGAEYVWLVNNDAFPEPDCLAALVAAMDADPTLAAVTPKIVGRDGTEEHAGGIYDPRTVNVPCLASHCLATPVGPGGFWLNGPCLLVRMAAVATAGGFDERFFAYWEEVDLFVRLGRLGYRVRAVPAVRTVHLGKVSSGDGGSAFWYLNTRNRGLMIRKHLSVRRRPAQYVRLIRDGFAEADKLCIAGKPLAAGSVVEGLIATFVRESGPPTRLGRRPRTAAAVARYGGRLIRTLIHWQGRLRGTHFAGGGQA